VKNPYPEDQPTHGYQDGGKSLATKWQTHPVTGDTTVTVLADRAYLCVPFGEPWERNKPSTLIDTTTASEPYQETDTKEMGESHPARETLQPSVYISVYERLWWT
jgi:hypothetical protein